MNRCGHDHAHDLGDGDEGSTVDPGSPRDRVSPAARPLLGMIRLYQHARAGRPSPCRFVPSCSTYAVEALQEHGAIKGSWLAVRRLGRCHPWGGQGYDPVPPRSTWNTAEAVAPATPDEATSPDEKVS